MHRRLFSVALDMHMSTAWGKKQAGRAVRQTRRDGVRDDETTEGRREPETETETETDTETETGSI